MWLINLLLIVTGLEERQTKKKGEMSQQPIDEGRAEVRKKRKSQSLFLFYCGKYTKKKSEFCLTSLVPAE